MTNICVEGYRLDNPEQLQAFNEKNRGTRPPEDRQKEIADILVRSLEQADELDIRKRLVLIETEVRLMSENIKRLVDIQSTLLFLQKKASATNTPEDTSRRININSR